MPEIAEVELVRRDLSPLCGQPLERAECEERLGLHADRSALAGRRVLELHRHGKLLGLELEGGDVITCHLRMTGHLALHGGGEDIALVAPLRALLRFEESLLTFSDPRGFGTLDLVALADFGSGLGPDLFALDPNRPAPAPKGRRAVKAVLLDQKLIAGIGNYLADEALWEISVNPQTPCNLLGEGVWDQLVRAARASARITLAAGGVSIRDYRRPDGSEGSGQELLRCYGRAGKPCLRCGAMLLKSKVAGRGTTFCPTCQC